MSAARIFAILVLVLPGLARADEKFYLKDGDRVVFYGDSITEQRLYTTFVETYVVTRFPAMKVTFIHSGWSGDRVTGGGGGPIDVRLKRDVLAYKPTVMTIMLGMNDASYKPFDARTFETYSKGMEKIVETVKSECPEIRITLIQPSPYDDVAQPPKFKGGYNAVLLQYGQFLKELAEKAHVDLADLNSGLVNATRKALENEPENASRLNPDRVHPGSGGQLIMAESLLEAWKAPALVTRVRLHLKEGAPSFEAEKAKVSNVKGSKDKDVSWTQEDEALPFPLKLDDPAIALAIRSSEFVPHLDQEILEVDGLEANDYTLKIDDQEVGHLSKAQLAEGVNLAVLNTPMAQQAQKVHDLTLKHNGIHYLRWRGIEVPFESMHSPHLARAIEELDALEAEVVEEQHETARPKPHRYQLIPRQ